MVSSLQTIIVTIDTDSSFSKTAQFHWIKKYFWNVLNANTGMRLFFIDYITHSATHKQSGEKASSYFEEQCEKQ